VYCFNGKIDTNSNFVFGSLKSNKYKSVNIEKKISKKIYKSTKLNFAVTELNKELS